MLRIVSIFAVMALTACAAANPPEASVPASSPTAEAVAAEPTQGEIRARVIAGEVPVGPATVDSLPIAPDPERLVVESLGIDMPVTDVGIDESGGMELPESAGVAGWFRLGGSPAGGLRAEENVVIAAHVDDSEMGRGPFAELRDAKPGDRVEVALEDGESVVYVVDRVEQTSKQEVDFSVVFGTAERALVLVTCGGRWDADVRHYEDNVLVWAYPEGDTRP